MQAGRSRGPLRAAGRVALAVVSAAALTACTAGDDRARSRWGGAAAAPRPAGAPFLDPHLPVADRVTDLLARMSLEDKAGQMIQADQADLTPAQLTESRIGSVRSGRGAPPRPNTPAAWADRWGTYQRAAMAAPLGIPMIAAIDAVPGSRDVAGSTVFPALAGLGATRDPVLVRRIGRAAAEEVTGAGHDWNLGPSLRVSRADRPDTAAGSFGGDPGMVGSMTTMIEGLQGPALNGPGSVLATAAHYLGDDDGASDAELRAAHLPPFREAVRRGAGSVLVSAADWRSPRPARLITGLLKVELGFTGFVVARTPATEPEVAAAVTAGVDMLMAGRDWPAALDALRTAAETHRIPATRIDDATRRILTKKFELGLFERPYPDRSFAGTIGSTAHRDLARRAVRESQVLLKNAGKVLPLATGGRFFVAGRRAAETTGDGGTSILQGIRNAVGFGSVTFDPAGYGVDASYDAAVAVVGGRAGPGGLDGPDGKALALLRSARIPLVVVLVSGGPLDIAGELGSWDAVLASWEPGSEGGGVADVLFGDYNPTGKLPLDWSPLFRYGYGLDYRR